jgi:hypothetical protein
MPDAPIEKPEDKDMQEHVFGKTVADKTEEAERQAESGATPPSDDREAEPHAGGKA